MFGDATFSLIFARILLLFLSELFRCKSEETLFDGSRSSLELSTEDSAEKISLVEEFRSVQMFSFTSRNRIFIGRRKKFIELDDFRRGERNFNLERRSISAEMKFRFFVRRKFSRILKKKRFSMKKEIFFVSTNRISVSPLKICPVG